MTERASSEVFDLLRRVIAWEMNAQVGIGREVEAMPTLIADSLLDYFEVKLKPGVDSSAFD